MQTITVKTHATFLLEKDICLEATTVVRLFLPPGILVAGEKIKDVVSLSDDEIEIGLRESKQNPQKLSAIIVFLKPNDRIKLHRSTEVMVDHDQDRNVTFNIVE